MTSTTQTTEETEKQERVQIVLPSLKGRQYGLGYLLRVLPEKESMQLRVIIDYSRIYSPNHPYHNFVHEFDVADTAVRRGFEAGLPLGQIYCLARAGIMHDAVNKGLPDDEEKSAEMHGALLEILQFQNVEIERDKKIIRATKIPTSPNGELEERICDADVDNLGRADFFERCEELRVEKKVPSKLAWYKGTAKFIAGHEYYTVQARMERAHGLRKNIEALQARIADLEGREATA